MRILRENIGLDTTEVILPCHSTILHVAPCRSGDERIDVWFLTPEHKDPSHYREGYAIHVAGTGHVIPTDAVRTNDYVGTCVMPSHLVWHVFASAVGTVI